MAETCRNVEILRTDAFYQNGSGERGFIAGTLLCEAPENLLYEATCHVLILYKSEKSQSVLSLFRRFEVS